MGDLDSAAGCALKAKFCDLPRLQGAVPGRVAGDVRIIATQFRAPVMDDAVVATVLPLHLPVVDRLCGIVANAHTGDKAGAPVVTDTVFTAGDGISGTAAEYCQGECSAQPAEQRLGPLKHFGNIEGFHRYSVLLFLHWVNSCAPYTGGHMVGTYCVDRLTWAPSYFVRQIYLIVVRTILFAVNACAGP